MIKLLNKNSMKRDFKVAMRGYNKKELMDENGQPQMINEIIGLYLYSAGNKKQLSADEKLRAYKLCVQLHEHPECVELTAEDMAFIKEIACDVLVAGAYGQIVEILEKES